MVYELRIYHIYPGKMEEIHRRFREVTIDLFGKHGIKVVDFWEDLEGNDKIYYLVEHPDLEARNRNFDAFAKDPEWIEAKRQSESNGPIVEKIEKYMLGRVPYSPAG